MVEVVMSRVRKIAIALLAIVGAVVLLCLVAPDPPPKSRPTPVNDGAPMPAGEVAEVPRSTKKDGPPVAPPPWTETDVLLVLDQFVTESLGPGNRVVTQPSFEAIVDPTGKQRRFVTFDGSTRVSLELGGAPDDVRQVIVIAEQGNSPTVSGTVWRALTWRLMRQLFGSDYDDAKQWLVSQLGSAQQLPDDIFTRDFTAGSVSIAYGRSTSERAVHDRLGRALARWDAAGASLSIMLARPGTGPTKARGNPESKPAR